jgi:hypothetical protein
VPEFRRILRQIDWFNVAVWGALALLNLWFWSLAVQGFFHLSSAFWAGFTSS